MDLCVHCHLRLGRLYRLDEGFMVALVEIGAALVVAVCLVHCVITDLKQRLILRRDCYLIALCGSVVQFLQGGLNAWLSGVIFAFLAVAVCLGVEKFACRKREKASMIGGGDIYLIAALSLATGPLACAGALGAASAVVVWAITGMITSRLTLTDTFPLAPCLAVWPLASLGVWLL